MFTLRMMLTIVLLTFLNERKTSIYLVHETVNKLVNDTDIKMTLAKYMITGQWWEVHTKAQKPLFPTQNGNVTYVPYSAHNLM